MKLKQCSRCKQVKSIKDFYKNKKTKDNLSSHCKVCHNKATRKWEQSPEGKKARSRIDHKGRLKREYNLTLEDYDRMLEEQNGGCFLCGDSFNYSQRLAVDHNHKTGKVRKLLCHKCNWLVGCIENNIELTKKILKYTN